MLLGWIGVAMTVASTFFVHKIYSGQLRHVRTSAEMSALVGADHDSDVSDEEGGRGTI